MCTHVHTMYHTVVASHPATVTWTPAVTTRHVPCHLDAHTCSDHTTSCHLDVHTSYRGNTMHTLSPGRAHTCSGHTTPCCHLDVHTPAVATQHPVTWMCTHLQCPHHTLSPGAMDVHTCSGHTTPCHLDAHACV